MEKARLLFLLLNLVTLEERRFHVDEIESLLVLSLLCQHFQVQIDKVLINVEVGLLHQFQKKQVCNIEYLGLEAQRQADQIHGLDGPLGVYVLLMHLVKMQSLVLLFKELAFANVRKEQLLSQVGPVTVIWLNGFQELRCIFILSKCCEDEDEILDRVWLLLVHGLDFSHEVGTLLMFTKLHHTVSLDSVEEWLFLILRETCFKYIQIKISYI